MALARSQWAADIAGQPAARMMETVAHDYTEFNGDYPTRIDGRTMTDTTVVYHSCGTRTSPTQTPAFDPIRTIPLSLAVK